MVDTFAVEFFLDHLSLERGLSEATVEAYRRDVLKWVAFARNRGVDHPSDATLSELRNWISDLQAAGLAPSSVRRARSALRTYYGFLVDEGLADGDPSERLSSPRAEKPLPHFLTQEETRALLAAPDPAAPLYFRDVAILEVMYGTGVRVSELVGLSLADLDDRERYLRVMGKGSKERLAPLGTPALEALRRYLTGLRPALDRGRGDRRIFLGARGAPLRREMVWKILKNCARRAGIPHGRAHPHTLRHTFATHLVEGGADLVTVQELLGHADVATTQIYTHLGGRHLLDAHRRFHPRAGRSNLKRASGGRGETPAGKDSR